MSPRAAREPRVAVVGAGVAGLACARALAEEGLSVRVFDKGRAVGGRLSTRAVRDDRFDLGAQYFTVRDDRFARCVRAWVGAGVCATWRGRVVAFEEGSGDRAPREVEPTTERLVGVPDMTALARSLARGLDVTTSARIERIARERGGLRLLGRRLDADAGEHGDLGSYDAVVVTVPAPQAAPLVRDVSESLAREASRVTMLPCFAVGLVARPGDALAAIPWDGAFFGRDDARSASALAWAARDSSKPGRAPGERWVLHASAAWSRARVVAPRDAAAAALVAELAAALGLDALAPASSTAKLWRYARAEAPLEGGALFDEHARVAVGGDWAAGSRVEGAFLSGLALAERVLGHPIRG